MTVGSSASGFKKPNAPATRARATIASSTILREILARLGLAADIVRVRVVMRAISAILLCSPGTIASSLLCSLRHLLNQPQIGLALLISGSGTERGRKNRPYIAIEINDPADKGFHPNAEPGPIKPQAQI